VEGVLKLSGVLATVASSLVLAHHMWPFVVSKESMHDIWHTLESLGNMIVFFLAGAKTGYIFLDIKPVNWVYLFLIYIFLLLLRAGIIFGSRPILKLLSADKSPVTWQDATLMTWGGLRGAVGLALALSVDNERAPHITTSQQQITKEEAELVLFFVSGIAFLTTIINATTAPTLVGWLQITAMPHARQQLLKMFHTHLVEWSSAQEHPPEVTHSLKEMLEEAYEHIAHQRVSKTGPMSRRSQTGSGPAEHSSGHGHGHNLVQAIGSKMDGKEAEQFQSCDVVLEELIFNEQKYRAILKSADGKDDLHSGLLGEDLKDGEHLLGCVQDMMGLIKGQWVDVGMAKVVNEIFLNMVYCNYWKLIEHGMLRPGSPESEVLLTSVRVSQSPYRADLVDYKYLLNEVVESAEF
jgi:hypothetical protein